MTRKQTDRPTLMRTTLEAKGNSLDTGQAYALFVRPFHTIDGKQDPVPAPPPHFKASPTPSGARTSTKEARPLPQEDKSARRIMIPMRCAQVDRDFVVVFRQNRISKGYFLERTGVPSATTNGPAAATNTYDISDLPFDRVKCPHCGAYAGPIRCGHGHFVCRGRVDEAMQYFHRCDSCGSHGSLAPTLRTVTGSEDGCVRRGPVSRLAPSAQTRLPPPASTMPLLPKSRR
jgi:hypothetical protein